MSISRHQFHHDGSGFADEQPDGAWVTYEDHAAEVSRLRKDAERYRWLREGDYTYETERTLKSGKGWLLCEEELDAAIDAVMPTVEPGSCEP